jgi:hypothetical protein
MYIDNLEPYYSEFHNGWFFYDETGESMGPYSSLEIATKNMDAYGYWLNYGPTRWQRIWWPIRYGVLSWLANLKKGASNLR